MLGAWAGHVTAQRDMEALERSAKPPVTCATARSTTRPRHRDRDIRVREVPLAIVMVALTTLTLWSLGQAIVQEPSPKATVRGEVRPV